MKLKDFRKLINDPELKEDYDMLMSSDEEGNSFSSVYEISVVAYKNLRQLHLPVFEAPNEKNPPNAIIIWPV